MSVDKVNKYKSEKEARAKALKKQKLEGIVAKVLVTVILIALVGWIGYSVYQKIEGSLDNSNGTVVNVSALEDYLNSMEVIEADPGE